jgi:hypothetical protein
LAWKANPSNWLLTIRSGLASLLVERVVHSDALKDLWNDAFKTTPGLHKSATAVNLSAERLVDDNEDANLEDWIMNITNDSLEQCLLVPR